MKINRIKCDRCGTETDANDVCAPRQVVVKMHEVAKLARVDRTMDLCADCKEALHFAMLEGMRKPE